MKTGWVAAAAASLLLLAQPAGAQETKLALGLSGWTGFAPLTLAKEAGIIKSIPDIDSIIDTSIVK